MIPLVDLFRENRRASGAGPVLASRLDVLLMVIWLAVGAASCYWLSGRVPVEAYAEAATDTWFDNDLSATLSDMKDRFSAEKSDRHPLFSAFIYPPTRLLVRFGGLEPFRAVRVITSLVAGAWCALLFLLLRALGCRRLDANTITLMGPTSATGVFLFTVAETFVLGSITILFCMLWALEDERGRRSTTVEAFLSAGTLSVTITNWMFGLASSVFRRRPAEALQVSLSALGLVAVLWTVQSYAFPKVKFFLGHRYEVERSTYLFAPEAGGPGHIAAAFAAHAVVMPAIQVVDRPGTGAWELLSVQRSIPGSAGPWGKIALAAWSLLLGVGIIAMVRYSGRPRFRALLAATLAGQLLLHMVFGYETFMYAPHWLPLLLIIAGFGTLTRWRKYVLALAWVCLVAAAVNNLRQFSQAVDFVHKQAETVARRGAVAPRSFWSGDGWQQIGPLVGYPGARVWEVAAPERSGGGGIWPGFDTFYIGFVVLDGAGRVVLESSDTLAGRFTFTAAKTPEGEHTLLSTSQFYQAKWQSIKPGSWRLNLEVLPGQDRALEIVLRGVGWQHSRIKEVRRDGESVTVNRRWTVRLIPLGRIVLGEELSPEWHTSPDRGNSVSSPLGLGFARLGPLAPGSYQVLVEDVRRAEGANDSLRTLVYGKPSARR